ncbi:hypothetical protein [Avibacterium paragallinarum]|uniref:hypothetical protein n=1 Tax=Avibacterium paragallinarum TaxID=728 RepID=UPI001F400F7F|nr:hypothetical protein [Avibacterium paragallinarum]
MLRIKKHALRGVYLSALYKFEFRGSALFESAVLKYDKFPALVNGFLLECELVIVSLGIVK